MLSNKMQKELLRILIKKLDNSGLIKKPNYNTKFKEIESRIPDLTDLIRKTNLVIE